MQPLEESVGSLAVLLVVRGDLLEELTVFGLKPLLVVENGLHAGPHGSGTGKLKERF